MTRGQRNKANNTANKLGDICCFFCVWCTFGLCCFQLSQDGKSRLPDILQDFSDDFQNLQHFDQTWTCGPRSYHQHSSKSTRNLWEHQAWVYGLRWRPVCCIFFLSDFLGFRHATAFSFLVFLDSDMSLHFTFCFVLRLFRFFRLCVICVHLTLQYYGCRLCFP